MISELKIVVADDEAEMREYYQAILAHLGHTVVGAARNGRELVEMCINLKPDLVITDILMPEMDGIEAIQEFTRTAPVPVIVVTAHNDPDTIDRATKSKILGYLVKPIQKGDIQPCVALAMRRFAELRPVWESDCK